MNRFSFYDSATGLIHSSTFVCSELDPRTLSAAVKMNTPAGHTAIQGRFDSLSQKVDIATGQVVDYQPPQPSVDRVWNAINKRWELSPEARDKDRRSASAKAWIAQLESQQHAAVRDFLLRGDQSKLAAIDAQIMELQKSVGD